MKITRRRFLKALAFSVGGAGLSGVGGYQYSTRIEPGWLAVERVLVPVAGLRPSLEGFKVVQMSDFHLYPYTGIDLVRRAVEMANHLQPDLVALTGDYVQSHAGAMFELAPVLAQINARYGVFAVLGNHDYWAGEGVVMQALAESGLPLLRNQGVVLDVGGAPLAVAGLDDGWSGMPDLAAALEPVLPDVPTVLLMHEPDFADEYAHDRRVVLQLSGHSHGGQVRLPGVGALVLPPYGRKYDQGLYRVQGMWLYTNRGIGVTGPPVRFCCQPEVTELTLVSGAV